MEKKITSLYLTSISNTCTCNKHVHNAKYDDMYM